MKKIVFIGIVACILVSCSQSRKTEDVIVTPTTVIENKAQSKKVCEPYVAYMECSIARAQEPVKSSITETLKTLKRRIENDPPVLIAQDCATYIRLVKEKPEIASQNGCFITEDTTSKQTVTTPAK